MTDTKQFDPYTTGSEERYAAMAAIRAEGGIVETAAGHYVATAAGVLDGLKHVEHFVGSFQDVSGLPDDQVPLPAVPEPRHGKIRRVVNTVVAPHRTNPVEPFVRELASMLLAETLAAEVVDLVVGYVDPIPSAVIAHVLGVPVEDRELFQRWSDELLANQQAATAPGTLSDYHPEFAAYLQAHIDHRRGMPDPPDDVITRFLVTDVDGELLSDDAIRTQVLLLIVAGNETTRNLLGNMLHTLALDPELYARVRADRSLVPIVVEESLRHDSPVQVLARAVLSETTITGCPVGPGDRVVFGLASANRDECVHADPDAFRVDRPKPRDHLAFGAGPHVCPGASLARMEAIVALEVFCDAVESFAPVDGFVPEPNPVFWALGHRSLPVIATPA
ncbi:MAG: Cytochrome [Actinomycetia bacterium]|nr:Cytochrome [Actinomycetes bacterium]